MSRSGIALLSLCVGLVVGLLLGYVLFQQGERTAAAVTVQSPDSAGARVYFYLVNDSTLSRHTISSAGGAVAHAVDTVAVSWR